jgi:NADH dehydrogenase/NADH:ubiquinone oxidoreductase subunit G
MTTVTINIDGRSIQATKGDSLLKVCLENDIYVPNLCFLERLPHRHASCRLCYVSIEGHGAPVTACTVRVNQGMVAVTDTPEVRALQKAGLKLLLSAHDIDCRHCAANRRCALQHIARFLKVGLTPKPLPRILIKAEPAVLFDGVMYHPNRCVLCGRCVHLCRSRHQQPLLTFAGRGMDTIISVYGISDQDWQGCQRCQACILACPVGALISEEGDLPTAV